MEKFFDINNHKINKLTEKNNSSFRKIFRKEKKEAISNHHD